MKLTALLLAALVAVPALAQSDGTRRALLVGVDDYAQSDDRRISNLAGPANDVPLMRTALMERGFDADDVDTLMGADATREGILGAIDALVASADEGDHLVFYFSGHGSQVPVDQAVEADGKLETIVPYDAGLGVSDIVDKDLRRRWNAALDRVGAAGSLTVVQDNCHSGSGSRDPFAWTPRQAEPAETALVPEGDAGPRPDQRDDVSALLLSASQDREVAIELPVDGVVHGGFTASFVRALRATPPGAPADLVFERTLSHVRALGLKQEGVIEGPTAQPLFGEDPAPGGGYGVGVVGIDGDRVTLRGGVFMGLNEGAELVRFLTANDDGSPRPDSSVTLRVAETEEAVRSVAEVTGGDASSVRVGDLFRVSKPVPMRGARPLRVWLPPAVADEAAVLAAAQQPCEGAPTCSDTPVLLPQATVVPAAAGWRSVPAADAGSGVAYRPLPPPASLRSTLAAELEGDAGVDVVDDPEAADYWLAGELGGGTPEYRWVRREAATSGDTLQALPQFVGVVSGDADGARTLSTAARRMARVHAWLTVVSPETASFPVQPLGLRRKSDGLVLRPDADTGVLTLPSSDGLCSADPDGCYTLAIGVTPEELDAYRAARAWERWDTRYAYAFIVDPVGESCLYFPFNRCRSEDQPRSDNSLALGDSDRLELAPTSDGGEVYVFDTSEASPEFTFTSGPFGRHTLVLLTTNEPEARPGVAFNWPAIHLGEKRGDFEDPASWSVHRLTIDVVPGAPAPAASGE